MFGDITNFPLPTHLFLVAFLLCSQSFYLVRPIAEKASGNISEGELYFSWHDYRNTAPTFVRGVAAVSLVPSKKFSSIEDTCIYSRYISTCRVRSRKSDVRPVPSSFFVCTRVLSSPHFSLFLVSCFLSLWPSRIGKVFSVEIRVATKLLFYQMHEPSSFFSMRTN